MTRYPCRDGMYDSPRIPWPSRSGRSIWEDSLGASPASKTAARFSTLATNAQASCSGLRKPTSNRPWLLAVSQPLRARAQGGGTDPAFGAQGEHTQRMVPFVLGNQETPVGQPNSSAMLYITASAMASACFCAVSDAAKALRVTNADSLRATTGLRCRGLRQTAAQKPRQVFLHHRH